MFAAELADGLDVSETAEQFGAKSKPTRVSLVVGGEARAGKC